MELYRFTDTNRALRRRVQIMLALRRTEAELDAAAASDARHQLIGQAARVALLIAMIAAVGALMPHRAASRALYLANIEQGGTL